MNRVLFVSNGHGEVAIAQRIAREIPQEGACDHLALVGAPAQDEHEPQLRDVGPRRAMPSGGLIAMGNVRNIVRDISAGLVGHTLAQLRFLHSVGRTYCAAVAVGDVFALLMALRARAAATVYVGTAKSVFVAPYGPLEERILAKAQAVFVRDAATAQRLRQHGIDARIANVIVDLYLHDGSAPLDLPFSPRLAIFPGSREAAYGDAVSLCRIVRELAHARAQLGAVLSVAPGLDAQRMATHLARDGWSVQHHHTGDAPFSLYIGEREAVRAWRGPIAAMLSGASLVLGQAGTANEGAAAAGLAVVAVEQPHAHAWYRKRQIGLLGEALMVVSANEREASRAILELLADEPRRARMGEIGRERMGPPGGAKAIAQEVVRLCS
jgi:uncharacterized protein (TIGR03492 family)